jgi:purine nucleoside permease
VAFGRAPLPRSWPSAWTRVFDLTKAYWLVPGIAGVNPNEASVRSDAWAEWVVDGDLAYEVDAREIPADWPTGLIPLGKRLSLMRSRPTPTARARSMTSIPDSLPGPMA